MDVLLLRADGWLGDLAYFFVVLFGFASANIYQSVLQQQK